MAGSVLYGRRAKLTIAIPSSVPGDFQHTNVDTVEINGGDDPEAPGLRIQFKITKTDKKDPNKSEITVTNLSPTRRSSLQTRGVKVTLDAGYAATGLSRLFRGDARSIDHVRSDADWDTVMKLGDGERSFRFARASESFAPGTRAGDVVRFLADKSGLAVGNVPDQAAKISVRFDQGYTVHGPVSKSMDKIISAIGYTWSIQNDTIQILPAGEALSGFIPEISPSTGLVGSPEMGTPEKKGTPALLKFQALLFPTQPGAKVKLISQRYNGFLRVKKCEFEGDTHGDRWYTTCYGIIVPT